MRKLIFLFLFLFITTPVIAGTTVTDTPLEISASSIIGGVYAPGGTDVAVTDGGTGTSTGSITGTSALTFTAGGTNQNVTLTPSGTGYSILNGNVGIGAATPAVKLQVGVGNSGLTNSIMTVNTVDANINGIIISNWTGAATTYGPRIHFDNSGQGNWYIGSSDGASNFDIATTWGTPRIRISSAGVVSIPNVTASRALTTNASNEITASTTTNTQVGYLSTTTSDVQTQLNGKYTVGGTDVAVVDGGTGTSTGSITGTGALTFAAGGTNQNVTLTPSGTGYSVLNGNVGIGTTSPVAKLDLRDGDMQLTAAGVTTGWTYGSSAYNIDTNTFGAFQSDSPVDGGLRIWGVSETAGQRPMLLAGIFGNTNPTDTVPGINIAAGKNNGIGDTVDLAAAETVLRVDNWAVSGLMTILGGGNVGIGTTTPDNKLDVVGGIFSHNTAGTSSLVAGISMNYDGTTGLIQTWASKPMGFETVGVRRMTIDTTGNVGIGVTPPTAALHLKAGTAVANTAPFKLTAGTNLTTPENGAIEFDGTNLYVTIGGVRKTITVTP